MRKTIPALLLIAIISSTFAFTKNKKHKLPKELKDLKAVTYIPLIDGQGDFYMFSTEVSNMDYAEFLWHLKSEKRYEELREANLDSLNWLYAQVDRPQEFVSGYSKKHNYPVVNVRKKGAELYCQWLSDHWNKAQETYTLEFRLPNKEEWQYAASGGNEKLQYTWGGPDAHNAKACYLGNFKEFEREGDCTVPATSFNPNKFGLYNMNGNVAEWLLEGNEAIGGAWDLPASEGSIHSSFECPKSAFNVGFRPLLIIKKKEH